MCYIVTLQKPDKGKPAVTFSSSEGRFPTATITSLSGSDSILFPVKLGGQDFHLISVSTAQLSFRLSLERLRLSASVPVSLGVRSSGVFASRSLVISSSDSAFYFVSVIMAARPAPRLGDRPSRITSKYKPTNRPVSSRRPANARSAVSRRPAPWRRYANGGVDPRLDVGKYSAHR
ncbi:hypothetical protein AVEN_237086-1 [Araneus ventricosus]|uniref:Uncharacterized protein n=1 Tax=Araneus ventricosus TaxID=182803 RepID=A0A4Y2VAT8_ARAVE|nr:hypothetical protein AVEN_237086-1 [Araneus ventricosus]